MHYPRNFPSADLRLPQNQPFGHQQDLDPIPPSRLLLLLRSVAAGSQLINTRSVKRMITPPPSQTRLADVMPQVSLTIMAIAQDSLESDPPVHDNSIVRPSSTRFNLRKFLRGKPLLGAAAVPKQAKFSRNEYRCFLVHFILSYPCLSKLRSPFRAHRHLSEPRSKGISLTARNQPGSNYRTI